MCIICAASCTDPTVNGTSLKTHQYDTFNFTDHSGRSLPNLNSLGSGALVTFLFTQCTDVCPITVHKIRKALQLSDHPEMPVIVFSVDPEGDNPIAIQKFYTKWDLDKNWYFVGGERENLEKVWKRFYVSPIRSGNSNTKDRLSDQFTRKYKVTHTAPVFVLDPYGIARVVHSRVDKEDDLSQDINIIMKLYRR